MHKFSNSRILIAFVSILRSGLEDLLRDISGPLGIRLRWAYYKTRMMKLGRNVTIDIGVRFVQPRHISIGDSVWIDRQVEMIAGGVSKDENCKRVQNFHCKVQPGQISIGSFSHIGIGTIIQGHSGVEIEEGFTSSARCSIFSLSNDPAECRFGTIGTVDKPASYVDAPISIGRNVWLGLGSVVLGSSIGDDCFAQPYSVIRGRFASNKILAGNPAQEIKLRFSVE